MVNTQKNNWHHMVYYSLWAYRITFKESTGFKPFQLIYGIDVVLPIECEIPTLHSTIELLADTKPLEQVLAQLDVFDEH